MSIRTNVFATLATQHNPATSPTFSALLRQTGAFFGGDSVMSVLLDNYLDEPAPSRSPCSTYLTAEPMLLNGLGIHVPESLDMYTLKTCQGTDAMTSHLANEPVSLADGTIHNLEDDPFIGAGLSLDSLIDVTSSSRYSSPMLRYPLTNSDHQDFWSSSSCSYGSSIASGISDMIFANSQSSLPDISSTQSIHAMSTGNSPKALGPFPDINMFTQAYGKRSPETGIDPSNIMLPAERATSCCTPMHTTTPFVLESISPLFTPEQSPNLDRSSPQITDAATTQSTSMKWTSVKLEPPASKALQVSPPQMFIQDQYLRYPQSRVRKEPDSASPCDQDRAFCAATQPCASPVASPSPLAERRDQSYQPSSPVPQQVHTWTPASVVIPTLIPDALPAHPHIDEPVHSPILNAHEGINLVDLLVKAARYRARCPGQDIDNTWLMAFAGKLSRQGELCQDFRCYVNGCKQTNKRRDHIVVHVGAHVDQRPFKCRIWSVNVNTLLIILY